MIDFVSIQTFIVVSRAGSFSAAAAQLGISAAMVGRRIQSMEDHLGVRLIERTTRTLRLTDTGKQFLDKGMYILDAYTELTELGDMSESWPKGRVRMTGPTTLGTKILTMVVTQLVESSPGLVIDLSLSDRKVDLITEGFDLAIRIGHLPSSGMVAKRVGNYRFVCCAAPAYLARESVPSNPAELESARCIINANLTPRGKWTFKDVSGKSVSVNVQGPLELNYDEAQRTAALSGGGIIYVPRHLVAEDLRTGLLTEILTAWEKQALPIFAVYPSRSYVPHRVSAVISAVANGLRE